MSRRAALSRVAAATALLVWAAYLAVGARYGPAGTCRGAVTATFSRGTTPGEFTVLRCSDYAGDAHRLVGLAAVQALAAHGLVMRGVRAQRSSGPEAIRPST